MFDQAYHHKQLNRVIETLTFNQFNSFSVNKTFVEVENEDLRKSVWLASILANSSDEEHLKKVQLFGSLLFLQYGTQLHYAKAAYVLFSRIGNLTATRFLDIYLTMINPMIFLKKVWIQQN